MAYSIVSGMEYVHPILVLISYFGIVLSPKTHSTKFYYSNDGLKTTFQSKFKPEKVVDMWIYVSL